MIPEDQAPKTPLDGFPNDPMYGKQWNMETVHARDAWRYANKARAAGSSVELETWPDMLHVWHLFEPILPEAQEAFERIGRFVERIRSGNAS